MARQFGLSQPLPKYLITKSYAVLFFIHEPGEDWFESCKDFFRRMKVFLNSLEFLLSFHCTKEFEDQWSLYYWGVQDPHLMAQRFTSNFTSKISNLISTQVWSVHLIFLHSCVFVFYSI